MTSSSSTGVGQGSVEDVSNILRNFRKVSPANAGQIQGNLVSQESPLDGQTLIWDDIIKKWLPTTLIDSPYVPNTVVNVGSGGAGVFKEISGVEIRLKKINAGSDKVTITNNTIESTVDVDIDEENINLNNLNGKLNVNKGGTGATTASDARLNLETAKSGDNSDITSLSGLTTPLSISQGGTNSISASDARLNLSVAKSGHNSDITLLSGLTTPLSIIQGGTSATNAVDARSNLGLGTASTHNINYFDLAGSADAVLASSLQKSNNLSDIISVSEARTNLGLGSASIINSF